jgi:hypothetical protein
MGFATCICNVSRYIEYLTIKKGQFLAGNFLPVVLFALLQCILSNINGKYAQGRIKHREEAFGKFMIHISVFVSCQDGCRKYRRVRGRPLQGQDNLQQRAPSRMCVYCHTQVKVGVLDKETTSVANTQALGGLCAFSVMLHHGPTDFVLWTGYGGTKVTEKGR